MAIRNIVKMGDPVLREVCREVTVFDDRLSVLIDDMIETMFSNDGVGLAAPQVGILRRVCVVCTDGETVYELVNPVIASQKGVQTGLEGCLSVPNRHGMVERPKKITVRAQDRHGNPVLYKVDKFNAVAFCHEIDHLDGILYIDKAVAEE